MISRFFLEICVSVERTAVEPLINQGNSFLDIVLQSAITLFCFSFFETSCWAYSQCPGEKTHKAVPFFSDSDVELNVVCLQHVGAFCFKPQPDLHDLSTCNVILLTFSMVI